ncbi:MAG: type IX secretion system outer membrane channel protein PorV [Bacteroidales bacterium]|nr:type IX secretion system outer membrane channel protein PorV [Bacteroidales bacterium]
MKNKLLIIFLLTVSLTVSPRLLSQGNSGELNAIQTVVPFLTIAPDSRAGAMGDAGVATSPDLYSMHWNPAKFAFIDGKGGAAISYSPWLRNLVPDINIAYLSGYYRIDPMQVISTSLIYSSLGDVSFTDDFGNLERTFKPNEWSFDLGYSRLFTEAWSGGIAFRFIYSNLTGGSYSHGEPTKAGISFAADISTYYQKEISLFQKDAIFSFGVNFSNIGSKMSYSDSKTSDFIPMNMRVGTAFTINPDNFNKITLTVDFNKLLVPTPPIYDITKPDSIIDGKDPNVAVPVAIFQSFYDAPGGFGEELREITYSLGAEYWYNDQFAIRTGYFHENQTKGNRKYLTAGAGFRLRGFTVDFSYLMPVVANHPLARTLRFSLAFDLNALRNANRSRE